MGTSTLIAPVDTSYSLTEFNREFDKDGNEAYNDSVGIQYLLHIFTATTQSKQKSTIRPV